MYEKTWTRIKIRGEKLDKQFLVHIKKLPRDRVARRVRGKMEKSGEKGETRRVRPFLFVNGGEANRKDASGKQFILAFASWFTSVVLSFAKYWGGARIPVIPPVSRTIGKERNRYRAHLRITGRVWCQVCTWNARARNTIPISFLIARLREITYRGKPLAPRESDSTVGRALLFAQIRPLR